MSHLQTKESFKLNNNFPLYISGKMWGKGGESGKFHPLILLPIKESRF
jgi:hypothetical protein